MHGFDLEQLRSLVAAVDAGSLTAAAPRRHLSQSAVSEHLRKLEEQAGRSLLLRSKSGVVPTEAGHRLVHHARGILALSESAWRDLRGLQLSGDVRLAITDYFQPGHITEWLAQFAARHPGIRFHVHIDRSDAIEDGYARGLFDVAIVMRVSGASAPGSTTLGSEELAWTGIRSTRLDKGATLPLVVLPPSCALRRLAESVLQKRRLPYHVAHVASGVAGVRSAVAAGLGIACLNLSALEGPLLALKSSRRLPALPQVRFQVLAARPGEPAIAASVRALAVEAFSRRQHG